MIRMTTVRVVTAYATLATLWFVFADLLARRYWPDTEHLPLVELAEGLAFVAATTVLLYAMLRRWNLVERRARGNLHESEERLRVAVAAANIGLFDWDIRTDRVRYSDEWKRQLGHEPDEIGDDPQEWRRRVHPDDLPAALETVQAYIRAPWPNFSLEFRMRHRDESYRWIRAQAALLADDSGMPVRIVGAHIDITDQVATRRALDAERIRFRALAEQSLVGIYAIDGVHFVYINPRAAEIFGYSVDELTGASVLDHTAEEDRSRVAENIRRRMSGEVAAVQYEFCGLRRDGSRVMLGVHGTRVDLDGQRLIIGVLADITDKLRHEQEIREHIGRLECTLLGTIGAISQMVELRDPYTAGHERRVGEMAAAIAAEMGLDENTRRGLRIAGAVHDVGKVTVPAEILAKPTRLTPAELELAQGHAAAGYEVLCKVQFPWPVAEVAYQHHERMDGSGYPRGLKGDEIILEARIIAVADVVESMSNYRPYRPAVGLARALEEIEHNAGTLYDPDVVNACLRLFREKGYTLPQ